MNGYAHAHTLLHTLWIQCFVVKKKEKVSHIGAHDTLTQYVVSNSDCAGMDLGSTEAMCVKLKLRISVLARQKGAKSAFRVPHTSTGWVGWAASKVS